MSIPEDLEMQGSKTIDDRRYMLDLREPFVIFGFSGKHVVVAYRQTTLLQNPRSLTTSNILLRVRTSRSLFYHEEVDINRHLYSKLCSLESSVSKPGRHP